MTDSSESKQSIKEQVAARCRQRAKEHTIAGGALGAASIGGFAVLGSVACPLCVVAAPALLGSGLWNAKKAKECEDQEGGEVLDGTDGCPEPA